MTKTYSTIYQKGMADHNEDRYYISSDLTTFAVMDGATGIGEMTGELASQTILDEFESNPAGSLLEILTKANKRLGDRCKEIAGLSQIEQIRKWDRSSSGVVAIRFLEYHRIEYVQSGDCMIFIQYEDDAVRPLTHDSLSRLDQKAILRRAKLLEQKRKGEDPNQWPKEKRDKILHKIWEELMEQLHDHRGLLNTPEGYPVIDGSPEAVHYIEYGQLPLIHTKKILLLSDGLVLPHIKAAPEIMWLETAKYAFSHGLSALYEKVTALENSDPACYIYPRFKQADDKTGILIELNK